MHNSIEAIRVATSATLLRSRREIAMLQHSSLTESPQSGLPPSMRVLFVSACNEPGSNNANQLGECLTLESSANVQLVDATLEQAMICVREESFACVLLHHSSHQDALATVGPLRTTLADHTAVLVLGSAPSEDMTVSCHAAGADGYACQTSVTVHDLMWALVNVAERRRLLAENRALQLNLQQQSGHHHQEAIHQLRSQRALLVEHTDQTTTESQPPGWLVDRFQELLRLYVVVGDGQLREEVGQLVKRLEQFEVTLAEALIAHSIATEQLVLGLGKRPAWHILGRANQMAYELVMQMSGSKSVSPA